MASSEGGGTIESGLSHTCSGGDGGVDRSYSLLHLAAAASHDRLEAQDGPAGPTGLLYYYYMQLDRQDGDLLVGKKQSLHLWT